jgi:hypothetical protein
MSCAVPHEGINRTGRMIAIGPLLLRFFLLLVVLVGRGDSSCPTGALVIPSTSTSIGAAAYKDCTAITAVTIPAAVTAIDATAFTGCTAITKLTLDTPLLGTVDDFVTKYFEDSKGGITELTIADTVTSLADKTCYECTKLKKLTIGDAVTRIGSSSRGLAFARCTSLDDVTLGAAVTSIGYGAFYKCSALASIDIPSSVTSINWGVFKDCSSLASIVIPAAVTSIGREVFEFCSSLASIDLPAAVRSIGTSAFKDCNSLASIDLPSSLTSIGNWAFSGCSSLPASINIPDAVTIIGENAFKDCSSLASITIPAAVTAMDASAFSGCTAITKLTLDTPLLGTVESFVSTYFSDSKGGITELTIADTVTILAGKTCYECTKLKKLTIGDAVTNILIRAFQGCTSLDDVTLGAAVTRIDDAAFSFCSSLASIDLPSSLTSIGNCAFMGCSSLPASINIPDAVTIIASSAFEDCSSLASITIPAAVTVMHPTVFSGCTAITKLTLDTPLLGTVESFVSTYFADSKDRVEEIEIGDTVTKLAGKTCYKCRALKTVKIGEGVTSIGLSAFHWCDFMTDLTLGASVRIIGTAAFLSCRSLTSIDLPDAVVSIGNHAFSSCFSLTSITIPNKLRILEKYTFSGCTALASVTIPSSLATIDVTAFSGCKAITKLVLDTPLLQTKASFVSTYFPDSKDTVEELEIGDTVTKLAEKTCYSCRALKTVKIGEGVTSIDTSAFDGQLVSSLTDVTLGASVNNIGKSAFAFNPSLGSINIPNGVTIIDSFAFEQCSSLALIELPGTLTTIGEKAFMQCASLTVFNLPNALKSIGINAFAGCTSITSVTIPDNVTVVADNTFAGCSSLTTVTIPDAVTRIGDYAFSGTSLTTVTIPDAVKTIGDYAYFECKKLVEMVIPKKVTSLGVSSFDSCTSLKSVTIEATTIEISEKAFANDNSLDEMKIATKESVTFSTSTFDETVALKVILFDRGVRGILSAPERFDHYVCSGGVCQCKPGAENVLSKDSDYFTCVACTPGKYSTMASLGSCLLCPNGKFMYDSGALQCEECIAGKYLDKEGMTLDSDCIECSAGTYGINVGMGSCTECPSGSYSTALKATSADTCVECPLDSYATGGASLCTECPSGESTNGKEGASACIAPESESLSLKNREDVLKLFSSGMAYMISVMICVVFAAMGFVLMTIRVKNATLCPLRVTVICSRMAIAAMSITSEAFMLAIMFSDGTPMFFYLGLIIVVGRCGNVIPTVMVLYSLFGSKSDNAEKYKKCFDHQHFLEKIQPYALLAFLSIWDCSLVAFLPWRYSEFAEKSQGFPDIHTLRTTSYYKIAQDITRFVCNLFYLLNAQGDGAVASVEVMTYFNMIASVAAIVLAGMVAVMKNSVLMEVEATKGTAADSQSNSGRRSTCGGGTNDGAIEMMEADGASDWETNPMHDQSANPSTLFVRYAPSTPVRTLLLQLLPGIDGHSLHAVDNAFKTDGVNSMEELKTYLEGGLIGTDELKKYASEGKLAMADVMVLVTCLKPFMTPVSEGSSESRVVSNGGIDKSTEVLSTLHYISQGVMELREEIKDKKDKKSEKKRLSSLNKMVPLPPPSYSQYDQQH